jgi:hypothetical protein
MTFLVSCGGTVPRPDTNLCVINSEVGKMKCFNLLRDYTDEGKIKPDAQGMYRDIPDVNSINKHICTDPGGFIELKTYIKLLREELNK